MLFKLTKIKYLGLYIKINAWQVRTTVLQFEIKTLDNEYVWAKPGAVLKILLLLAN